MISSCKNPLPPTAWKCCHPRAIILMVTSLPVICIKRKNVNRSWGANPVMHCNHHKPDIQVEITALFIHYLKPMEKEPSGSPLSSPHRSTLQNRLEYRDPWARKAPIQLFFFPFLSRIYADSFGPMQTFRRLQVLNVHIGFILPLLESWAAWMQSMYELFHFGLLEKNCRPWQRRYWGNSALRQLALS